MHTDFTKLLKKTSALKTDREATAGFVIRNPEYYQILLEHGLNPEPSNSKKACWVLELVLFSEPKWLDTHRDLFFLLAEQVKEGSALRPLAKIIAYWSEEALTKKTPEFPSLNREETAKLTTLCFTWLLEDLPVAVKVFSMEALFHLGKQEAWIHKELMDYLERNYDTAQPAFKARARDLLKKLKK